MNEEFESFEQRLKRQPLRQVPAEWRKEILQAAGDTESVRRSRTVAEYSFLANLNRRLASILWPHPVAWAGLATIWVFIVVLNFSNRDTSPTVAEKSAPASPEVMAELRQQQRLYVELTGVSDSGDADRQKTVAPRPRSERSEMSMA